MAAKKKATGGGKGFGGGADRILPTGRVRTAAGGTRNRGGALATTGGGGGGRRRRGNQTRGVRNGTINAGGRSQAALPPVGGNGMRGNSRTGAQVEYERKANRVGARVRGNQARNQANRTANGTITPTSRAQNRANAIRALAQNGATPGERSAAVAAASRLGIGGGTRGGATGGGRIAGLLPAARGGNVPGTKDSAEKGTGTGLKKTGTSIFRGARPGEFSQRKRGADARARLRNLARTGSPATQARARALGARVGVKL